MQTLQPALAALQRACRRWGPYVLLELVLPGGTLMAVLLYVHHRLQAARGHAPAHRAACAPAVAVLRLPVRIGTLPSRWPAARALRLACRAGAC